MQNIPEELSKRLYVRNLDMWANEAAKDYHVNEQISVKNVKSGIIEPAKLVSGTNYFAGGVCDDKFNFVGGLVRFRSPGSTWPCWGGLTSSYQVDEKDIEHINETVLFGGVLIGHYGHCIAECIPARLWWHIKNPDSKIKIAFITTYELMSNSREMYNEFFELLGISEDRIVFIEKPTQFDEVIVPEQSVYHWGGEYFDEFMLVIDFLRDKVDAENYEKIYFSRSNLSKKDCVNEKYFENFFSSKGFEIVSLEKYNLKEKLSILKGAKEIITSIGTGSHWALFCQPGTKVVIFPRTDDETTPPQFTVNQANKLDYYIVDVSMNFMFQRRQSGKNLIGPTEYWRKYVQDFYSEEITETPEDCLKENAFEYLKEWCLIYSNWQSAYLADQDMFDVINNMNRIFFNKTLKRESLLIGSSKAEIKKGLEETTSVLHQDKVSLDLLANRYKDVLTKLNSGMEAVLSYKSSNFDKMMDCLLRPQLKCSLYYDQSDKWTDIIYEGETFGLFKGKKILSVKLDCSLPIYYSVYVRGVGWQDEVMNGKESGTLNAKTPIASFKVRFSDQVSKEYSIKYRLFTQPGGWSLWSSDGAIPNTLDCKYVEGIQIVIEPKSDVQSYIDDYFNELDKKIFEKQNELQMLENMIHIINGKKPD